MTRRIVIAGAGGFGRGVYEWLASSARHREEHRIVQIVFIDDARPAIAPQAPIVSSIADYQPTPGDAVLCAIGVPRTREAVVGRLRSRGATFHTFVDDRATVGSRVRVGEGAVVCPGVVVSADALIGAHVHINFNCSVGHDTELGDYTTLSPSVNLMGDVIVERNVFFGGSAVVLPRLRIASGSTVGAGAVVVRDIELPETIVAGNPATALQTRADTYE